MKNNLDRRKFIQFGSTAVAALGTLKLFGKDAEKNINSVGGSDKPVTFLVLGCGSRGTMYSSYSQKHPDEMKIIGAADPHEGRRDEFTKKFNVPKKGIYKDWKEALSVPKFADAVIISTPDKVHYEPAMKALEMGYDVLLEKPIAPTPQECIDITTQSKKYKKIIAVCHVLRYTPFYRKMKEIIDSGMLGDVMTIEHTEPVNYWHQAHSYVRGNWRNAESSSPMILAKSCHDLDIMRWLINEPSKKIASFGSLSHFKIENAPAGSTDRCINGCAVEPTCPYSAMKIYLDMNVKGWPVDVITQDMSLEGRTKALKEGPYGRCVYRCDNNVVDHQVVSMEFGKGRTASFTMAAFNVGARRTRVMGTMGEATGDSRYIEVVNFRKKGEKTNFDTAIGGSDITTGHGGGDMNLVKDFVKAVRVQDPSLLTSTIDASLESHLMAFAAEESRLEGKIISLNN